MPTTSTDYAWNQIVGATGAFTDSNTYGKGAGSGLLTVSFRETCFKGVYSDGV